MVVIRPPETRVPPGVRVFLAGGITGCPDWRTDLIGRLKDVPRLVVLNPLCEVVPDPLAQITWEYTRLNMADIIAFWFPQESICPITLFELGAHLSGNKKILVGIHPNYPRRFDVETQVILAGTAPVVYSLEVLARYINDSV